MNTEQKETVIGTAKLEYDEAGQLEAAVFYPKIKVDFGDIKEQLGTCTNKTIDHVRNSAQLLLASFFNKISDIELRDMEISEIKAETVVAEKYIDGTIKSIEIEFKYKVN